MKTLGLNAHMEGWWGKRQTEENHPKVKLHKKGYFLVQLNPKPLC